MCNKLEATRVHALSIVLVYPIVTGAVVVVLRIFCLVSLRHNLFDVLFSQVLW